MSRRTAEANKAIAVAWENEQKLVSKGQGTREWTQDQQRDISERGKAYDENGRAFEGQHMKSVEKYPEYQGDPGNIQFLSKQEHLEAHGGNWKNPTNWYFDPVTKEITAFGEAMFIPCKVIDLKEPIRVSVPRGNLNSSNGFGQKASEIDSFEIVENAASEETLLKPRNATSACGSTKHFTSKTTSRGKTSGAFWRGLKALGKKTGRFCVEHKGEIIKGFLTFGSMAVKAYVDSKDNSSGGEESNRRNSYDRYYSDDSYASDIYDDSDISEENSESTERSSPREHNVSGYDRQQNGKTVYVKPYKRGGKKDE